MVCMDRVAYIVGYKAKCSRAQSPVPSRTYKSILSPAKPANLPRNTKRAARDHDTCICFSDRNYTPVYNPSPANLVPPGSCSDYRAPIVHTTGNKWKAKVPVRGPHDTKTRKRRSDYNYTCISANTARNPM